MQFLVNENVKRKASERRDFNVKMVTEEERVYHFFRENRVTSNRVGSISNSPDWPVGEDVSCESQ